MDDLRELYQTTILDHNKKPRNFGPLEDANREADGHNPLCGDQLHVSVRVDDQGAIEDIRFTGTGCAISRASASLMTEYVKGRSRKEVDDAFERFHDLLTTSSTIEVDTQGLGKLAVFAGVREYPMRVKCATLAWHTLEAALEGSPTVARTE
jgi:nitrogen fixation NifU-like protein